MKKSNAGLGAPVEDLEKCSGNNPRRSGDSQVPTTLVFNPIVVAKSFGFAQLGILEKGK